MPSASCPHCGKRLKVPDGYAHPSARCPACKCRVPLAQSAETIAGPDRHGTQEQSHSSDAEAFEFSTIALDDVQTELPPSHPSSPALASGSTITSCPFCQAEFAIEDNQRGLQVICPECRQVIAVTRRGRGVAPKAKTPMTSGQGWVLIAILLFLAAILGGIGLFNGRPTWEYLIVAPRDNSFVEEMDRLGSMGWEVVSARRASGGELKPTYSYEVILKRRK
jgi:predicted Zn finger-like uncharacterized protein